jgi:hypothetical protein
MEREALKLALEALESVEGVGTVIQWKGQWELCHEAITAIREALAQPAQEPAGWMCSAFDGEPCEQLNHDECENPTPLYTKSPKREWVGLSEKEMQDAHLCAAKNFPRDGTGDSVKMFADAIEAKLKEKNA